jgi:hypothetical protein
MKPTLLRMSDRKIETTKKPKLAVAFWFRNSLAGLRCPKSDDVMMERKVPTTIVTVSHGGSPSDFLAHAHAHNSA